MRKTSHRRIRTWTALFCLIGSMFFVAPSHSAGLFAHWKFDEAAGTLAADTTGRFPGTLTTNGAGFVSGGVSGNAVQLDRTQDGFVRMPPLPGLVAGDFTFVMWIRTAPGDTTRNTFPMTLHESWYENGFFLYLNNYDREVPGKAGFVVTRGTQTASASTLVNDGQWHQLALTYSKGGETMFYVDGPPVGAHLQSISIVDRKPPLLIGANYGNEVAKVARSTFSGWVDDVQIYDQALTTNQIELLFRNPGRTLSEVETPLLISPATTNFVASVEVRLTSSLEGTTIRYTLDGTEPTTNSAAYQKPLTLSETTVVKARLFLGEFPVSEVVSATFTRLPPVSFEPAAGRFENALTVMLRNNLGLGTLTYTLDGSDPSTNSVPYGAALALTTTTTIKARIFVNGFPASEIQAATYTRVYAIEDGIPRDWRERYFGAGYETDPRVAAEADPDQDGWNNRLEYQSGTHPLDANSKPEIVAAIRAVPLISWNTIPGQNYRVWWKTNVSDTGWQVLLPTFQASQTTSRHVDPDAPPTAVYRIELVP